MHSHAVCWEYHCHVDSDNTEKCKCKRLPKAILVIVCCRIALLNPFGCRDGIGIGAGVGERSAGTARDRTASEQSRSVVDITRVDHEIRTLLDQWILHTLSLLVFLPPPSFSSTPTIDPTSIHTHIDQSCLRQCERTFLKIIKLVLSMYSVVTSASSVWPSWFVIISALTLFIALILYLRAKTSFSI